MNMNLRNIPFSRKGSYMAISDLPEKYRGSKNQEGIHLRTIRGGALSTVICRIFPTLGETELKYEYKASPNEMTIQTAEGSFSICFADEKTILIKGEGSAPQLCLGFVPAEPCFDYLYKIPGEDAERYLVNCFGQNVKYLVWAQEGMASMEQSWDGCVAADNRIVLAGKEKGLLAVIREVPTEWDGVRIRYEYETAREKTRGELEEFYRRMPSVPERFAETARMAAYVDWSCIVAADGFLKRDAMYMSKNWMCNLWAWDHAFNAVALAYANPEAAWDQFMVPFDWQDATGRIPDSINNFRIDWNYCKPPVHGWALSRMMRVMELTPEQMAEAYDKLGKWTDWWLNCRDYDGDGLCEYTHGYDSGWDNATVFRQTAVVATPDLQAYLILQMETLADLAGKLERRADARIWRHKAENMLDAVVKNCFRDGKPLILESGTHRILPTESLLPYTAILLGRRLPEGIRKKMIAVLKSGKFRTAWGFATESPSSEAYQEDGYWLGPIWAPSTLLILDGLKDCGEEELVESVSEAFCEMVSKHGFAENFHALTGEGLRDRAYTWTPSVFLTIAHDFLR